MDISLKLRSTALVKGFRQSAPYVNAHQRKVIVIMLGGEAIADENFPNIVNDIALLHSLGIKLVLVYGARTQINTLLDKHNLSTPYHKGARVTDSDSLELVKQAAGQLQLDITARLSMSLNNTPMANAQINVVSGNFVIAQPLGVDDGVDYCHSGRIRRIDIDGIRSQLNQQAVVLLGPVASSVTGECFNLCSEEIATEIAIKLNAEKLIGFCSSKVWKPSQAASFLNCSPTRPKRSCSSISRPGITNPAPPASCAGQSALAGPEYREATY